MAKYISNRQQNLKIGIVSYTEDKTVLEVIGNVGIGTTNSTSKLHVVGDARITGILTIGTSSIVLDGKNNKIYVGSGVTISATEISIGSNIIGSGGFSGNASSAIFATSAGIATYATNAGIATYATNAGIATYATNAGVSTYATNAGIATYATNAGIATYADNAGVSTYATNAGVSTYATNAGIATYATNAGIATYATNAGIATYATNAGIATYATNAGIATYATNAGVSTYATNAGIATYATNAGVSTYATNAGIATYATNAGIATYADNAGVSTYATNAGIATYATNAGIATSVIGGIASVTSLSVSGVSTVGVLTASSIGIGTTNATSKLWVDGDGYFTGILTANRIISSVYGEFFGGSVSVTSLVGTSLSISGISTLGVTSATNLTLQQLNVSGITTLGFVTTSNIYSSGVVTATTFYGSFSGNASSATFATNAGIVTNIKGGVIGNIPYQSAADTTAFLTNGSSGTILQSNGIGNVPTWVTPAAAAGAITGLTIRDENNIVSGLNSVSALNFVGSIVSVASTAGIATITFLDYVSNAGVATFATNAGIATYATNAGIATYATNAGVSTYADNAGIATYATNAGIATYATNAGVSTYATNAGIATFATNAGIATYATNAGIATYATNAGIATYATNAGVSTYATNAGIATFATNAGIATYATNAGIATYATNAGIATALQYVRTFQITGDVVASPISFDGTGNVSLAATIQPNSVGLGTDTTGDYVRDITGTANQITVTGGTGESSTPTLSVPSQFTAPQDVTVTRDLLVSRNLNVNGNITIGGTSATLFTTELKISDPDIVLGFRTDGNGNDVSTDNTANHGGVAIASTEGKPLVDLFIAGIETTPATYKKIMWFKSGTFAGLGTDAWLINYAVGIGSTQFPTGTRLAAGNIQFTQNDLSVVRNVNASGIVTATTFIGALTGTASSTTNIPNLTGAITSNNTTTSLGSFTSLQLLTALTNKTGSGENVFATSPTLVTPSLGIATATSIVVGSGVTINTSGINATGIITASSFAGNASSATFATSAGIATYTSEWVLGANGSSDYTFTGPGLIGAENDPVLYLVRGQQYKFTNTMGAHPFRIQSTVNGSTGTQYNDGITNNDVSNGTLTWNVQFDAPNILYYQCTAHGSMGGKIYIIDAGIGPDISINTTGIITASSFAGNASSATFSTNAGISTNLKGGVIGNIPYQAAADTTAFLINGSSGTILQSNGVGNAPTWVTPAAADAITGLTIRDEGTIVGGANSVSALNFVGSIVSVASTAGIATITFLDYVSNAGVATFATNAGISTNLKGGVIGNIPYQSAADTTAFLTNGSSGTILQSNGVGNAPTWVTPAAADAITGLTIRDENNIVSGLNSVSALNFVGSIVSVASTAGIATITFLDYVSNAGIATFATNAGISTNLKGGVIGNIPYQSAADTTAFLTNGSSGTILQSNGVGNAPTWVTAPPAAAITGLTIRDEGTIVGGANSVSALNFVGSIVSVASTAGIATITFTAPDPPVGGKFDTSIDNVLYIQPTGTLDIVGVGTTTTQITTLPSGSNKFVVHSIHVTNISNGDAEITASFDIDSRKVLSTYSSGGGAGIHTCRVSSASSISIGMGVTGTNIDYNTLITDVSGTMLVFSKPLVGTPSGTLTFIPTSKVIQRLPVPVGSAVELIKQPFILYASDSIRVQATGVGTAGVSTTTATASSGAAVLTVASATNIAAGQLVGGTGISTNTYVGVGYIPASTSVPITRATTAALSSTAVSFADIIVPQDGALHTTIVYQTSTDTSYNNGTSGGVGVGTIATVYYGTGNTYPSIVQSIRVANISDIGDYPVWVGIGNSDTVFSWLAYNMIIPKNSSIEICESPKRLGIGQSIFAYSDTPNSIEIQVAAKQKI